MGALAFFVIGWLLLWLAQFACFVALMVEMFKNEETGWGVACIVLTFCTGLGPLIALVYGWTKVGEWDTSLLMVAYSLCFLGLIVQYVLWFAKFGLSLAM